MQLNKFLIMLAAVGALVAPPLSAETKTFFGVDAVKIDTEISYDNGEEDYEFDGIRFRWGAESSKGASAGIELITGDKDDIIDPFDTPFRLETGPSLGVYATLGKPVYLRLGWSIWKSEYTNLVTDVTDDETVNSFEIGLGFNFPLAPNMTFYADYAIRDTEAEYPSHIFGGEADYESKLISAGFNYQF